MRNFFLTPGPAELYPTVEDHIKTALKDGICSISHRSSAFKKIYAEAVENLRELLHLPEEAYVSFLGSANEIWERSLQNLCEERSLHFVNGSFSESYAKFATALGKKPTVIRTGEGKGFSLAEADAHEEAELIAVTANETSTGVWTAGAKLRHLREKHRKSLIAVDAVSILPCYTFDFALIDTIFFSVQKAFGLPAGLGVWIYNEKCLQKAAALQQKGEKIGTFHALPELAKRSKENQTPETPNVLNIYLLAKVSGDMLRYGRERMMREQIYKANLLYHTAGKSGFLRPFVQKSDDRSPSVVVLETAYAKKVIDYFIEKHKLQIGAGYGNFKEKHLRIANFPAASKERIEMLCDEFMRLDELFGEIFA